jgi:hypothetical protein
LEFLPIFYTIYDFVGEVSKEMKLKRNGTNKEGSAHYHCKQRGFYGTVDPQTKKVRK